MTSPIFETAVNQLILDEGGFVVDQGGPTNHGITLTYLQNLNETNPDFVASLDIYDNGQITENSIRKLSTSDAVLIYQKFEWLPIYDQINYPLIAAKLFNIAIDCGRNSTVKCLQRSVRAASGDILDVDGDMGSNTLAAVNNCNAVALYAAFKSELAAHYRSLNQPQDLDGWLNRAYR